MPTTLNLTPILAEITFASLSCVVLLLDLFFSNKYKNAAYFGAQLTLIIVFAMLYQKLNISESTVILSGHFLFDKMSVVLKLAILAVSFFAFFYSNDYLRARGVNLGEYYVLALFSILGMLVLVSANSLLIVYLGLELLSLPLYALVAINRKRLESPEAAMKYFVMGGLASAMLLYGMSLIYGVTGSLEHHLIATAITGVEDNFNVALGLGVVFIVVGIGFKFGAAPFHMWVPDIYQGAPTPVALFIGTAPKIAAFAMMMRLLAVALPELTAQWSNYLMMIAILSIILGNVIAIAQTNVKRLLAYSAISHVGFIMLGMLVGTEAGFSASMFYVIVYAITSLAAFGVLILLSKEGFEAETLDDFKGLNARSPWHAFMMLIVVFSMAGVPPMIGFYAKFLVLSALVKTGFINLAIFAVVFSVIGAFYYLRLIKLMYFDSPEDPSAIETTPGYSAVLSINSLAILGLGIFPNALIYLCSGVFG